MRNYLNIGATILTFIMGQSCNMNCKYCLKHTMVNEQLPAEVSDDVWDYLDFLAEHSPNMVHLNFYGGEPLLYFEGIKEIVEYTKNSGMFTYGMISNGKALTQEIVDYINDNNISYMLSWDGVNSMHTRGYNAEQEKKDLLMQIKTLGLTGVITSISSPLSVCTSFQDFDNEYYEANGYHIRVNFDTLLNTGQGIEAKKLLDINRKNYKKELEMLFGIYRKYALNPEDENYFNGGYVFIQFCQQIMGNIKAFMNNGANKIARCSQGTNVINMDLDGYMYDCHNITTGRLGHITDTPMSIIQNTIASEYPIMHRLNTLCKDCEAMAVCAGGCKHVADENLICDLEKIKYEVFANGIIELSREV